MKIVSKAREEYTKITTPRQDVLFKKGYLGRKRPTPTVDPASTPGSEAGTGPTSGADVVNGGKAARMGYQTTNTFSPRSGRGGFGASTRDEFSEPLDSETSYEVLGPEDPPQFIYTNGFVDQNGLYFINGGSYELYDPYSGNVTVVVGPAPPYPGGGGPPPVLAAVPCNPLPLQPLEWFNPAFLSCVAAPCQPQCMGPPRGKRYSLDSQNCSPQSSESTGSPQEGEEPPMQFHPQAPPPYVYPGYMFGPPVYNMNGEYRLQVKEAPILVSRSISPSTRQRISFRGSSPGSIQRPTFVRMTVTSPASPILTTSLSNDSKQPRLGVVELCNKTGRTQRVYMFSHKNIERNCYICLLTIKQTTNFARGVFASIQCSTEITASAARPRPMAQLIAG
uniref:Uncharacterized protein n=1 Tax=Timema monikensis TaxID=170555 RepID=A0A7R9HPW9_9NEOP|nr:unnamed protein product [Timema monikensis]